VRPEKTMSSHSQTLLSPEVWSRKAPATAAVLTASWMTTLPVIVALTVSDCCGEAAKDAGPVSVSNSEFGFRYDPMKWLKSDRTLQGALVRTRVLGNPTDRDREILEKKIKAILTDQKPDGALSDHILHAVTQTGGRIRELIELGASPDRPELKNALAYVLKHGGKDKGEKQVGLGMARALNLMGAAEKSAVKNAVKQKIDRSGQWNHTWAGCPWTPSSQLKQVWDVRVFDDRSLGVIMKGLKEIEGKLNSAGCP